jgi:ubiquinone/menaquinone biosynthesis C-methylase UbiE
VLSSFGLNTFTHEERGRLAGEVYRILKPGGRFSFVEISVPTFRPIRAIYMCYVRYGVPLLGRLLLGNPDNYRLLGVYTTEFGDCSAFAQQCVDAGLESNVTRFFFGCATGVVGLKPPE